MNKFRATKAYYNLLNKNNLKFFLICNENINEISTKIARFQLITDVHYAEERRILINLHGNVVVSFNYTSILKFKNYVSLRSNLSSYIYICCLFNIILLFTKHQTDHRSLKQKFLLRFALSER